MYLLLRTFLFAGLFKSGRFVRQEIELEQELTNADQHDTTVSPQTLSMAENDVVAELASISKMIAKDAPNLVEIMQSRLEEKTQENRNLESSVSQKDQTVDINGDWLIVNNHRYSRKKAQGAWLGRIGRAVGPWVAHKPVLVNFKAKQPQEWLHDNVKSGTTVTLTAEQARQVEGAIDFKVPLVNVSGNASITHNSSREAKYVLREFQIDDVLVIKHWYNEAKSDEDRRMIADIKDMRSTSDRPRFVTTVWLVVSGDPEKASACTGGRLNLRYGGTKAQAGASISGSGCGNSTFSFNPDTVLAYEASYFEMDGDRVKDIKADHKHTR